MEGIKSLADSCRHYLSSNGRLARALPGFVARAVQSDMAVAIAKALERKSILVVEAGTGTGKTYAYLLPCLLSGKKALISTATKTLQDQLFLNDLPSLVRALGLSIRIQNLKGRSNYICHHRLALHAEEGQFQSPQCLHEILQIRAKLSQMQNGERSELPEISEDSSVWQYVTSNAENCLGSECPSYERCFLVKARKRALEADLVVTNHHLFFADSRLKQEGFAELLPGVEVVVFDEAHQLLEIATQFNGDRIGTRQFRDLMDDLIKEWPVLDLANQPLKALIHKTDKLMEDLSHAVPGTEDRLAWEAVLRNKSFTLLWDQWLALVAEIEQCFEDVHASIPALKRCKERLLNFKKILLDFSNPGAESIRWLERFKRTLVFHATAFDVAKLFSALLKRQPCTYIFTSATLAMAGIFDCFCKPLGLEKAETLLLPSPFNLKQQALLYLPRGLPDPRDLQYYEVFVARALPIIEACAGRCFLLFTSHRALKLVAQMMTNTLNYPLLVQGDEAKPILLARFRELGNAVLLGTASFWEGVDVKGAALSCVMIDKLPFANPTDPIVRGRMIYLKQKGLSAFDELSLPSAIIALKQGVGRLIRDVEDKGVLMIADPRLTGRAYGRFILASLPPLAKTREEKKVLTFIKEWALHDESVSA